MTQHRRRSGFGFTVLLFGFRLIALIEGVLLHPYGLSWFVPVVGITLFVTAKIAPKLLGRVVIDRRSRSRTGIGRTEIRA
jgi:hypothetical protein